MAFSTGSKLVLMAVVFLPAPLGTLALAGEPAIRGQHADERRAPDGQDLRREEARLQREIKRLELERRALLLTIELYRVHLEQLRLLNEPDMVGEADLERSHPLDGQGWRVDAHGIIRDRSWRPVGNWGVDNAIGLWGVDDDGSLIAR